MTPVAPPAVCLIGHPYAPIGMGEHVRLTFRAMRAAGMRPALSDVYAMNDREAGQFIEFSPHETATFGRINVWHINGNELAQALPHTRARQVPGACNVIYPAWELATYPAIWARQLDTFDEVWAPSRFIHDSIARAVTVPVVHMPLACEVLLESFLGRRYFGLRESAFSYLFFFDIRSFQSRKNPEAVIDAFTRVAERRPDADLLLVMKVNGAEQNPEGYRALLARAASLGARVLLLPQPMTDNEAKNLVRCCDAFVSLHRSEGFGRGMAEAMCLGKAVIATGYSGNMDFCDETTALLVPYRLVEVPDGAYPHGEGQVWAEPDVSAAAAAMERLLDERGLAERLGERAAVRMQADFGLRVAGVRFRERIGAIERRNGRAADAVLSGVQDA
jgi:glycosyltransferase involved in cell wall biosynthesis